MALYYFDCLDCEAGYAKVVAGPALTAAKRCKVCGSTNIVRSTRSPSVSTKIVEVLDSGPMSRKVERLADVERLVKERVDPRKAE